MSRDEKMKISLTGENSHIVKIPLGQGSFSIGSIGMDTKKFDVLVDEKLPINWNSFNTFFTGYGKENSSIYPYGNWPRLFYYWGNDFSFIKWSEKRKIEDFTWCPNKSVAVDFTKSNISRLMVNVENNNLKLKLGNHHFFSIAGNLANVEVSKIGEINSLSFSPKSNQDDNTPLQQLPLFKVFSEIRNVSIYVEPLGKAFDCNSLLQFKNLTHLNLSGNLTNLESLKKLSGLESLAIRYAPKLENFPALQSWEKLTSFIGWNIEETKGKLLRSELKELAKERELKHSSISQIRKSIWFITEYGIPFSFWEKKNAKTAVKNYKATLKQLKKVKTEKEAKDILVAFTKVFNDLPNIETTEREDIGEAINQLRQVPSFEIDAKKANKWFDAVRDY